MFTKVTLNSFIVAINIFIAGPTMKFGIIVTTKHLHASSCLLHMRPVE